MARGKVPWPVRATGGKRPMVYYRNHLIARKARAHRWRHSQVVGREEICTINYGKRA